MPAKATTLIKTRYLRSKPAKKSMASSATPMTMVVPLSGWATMRASGRTAARTPFLTN